MIERADDTVDDREAGFRVGVLGGDLCRGYGSDQVPHEFRAMELGIPESAG